MQALRQRHRLVVRAHAGASARQAELEQHLERHAARATRSPGLDQGQLRGGVDEEDDAQPGVLAQQLLDCRQVGVAEHDVDVLVKRLVRTAGKSGGG